jgi:CDP-glucose 4,6-dehydratase
MDFSIYKNKRVFLTGHTGFKGSWMLNWLHQIGAIVKGYALNPINDFDLYNAINGDEMCESIIDDIRNKENLEKALLSFEPDFIFHLAAQPLVRLSYEMPTETFDINVIGTANLLNAVRKLEKKCVIVIITTDKVYDNLEWHYPYRENDKLGGYDPYSASKACAELVINSYRNSFFNNANNTQHQKSIASARAGNVIGGGDWSKDRIIPDIVNALKKEEKIVLRNPKSIRPWQHVLEPISGYLTLGKKMYESPTGYNDSWNFGPYMEDNLIVEDLAIISINTWGAGEYEFSILENQPHEAGLLKLDINKTTNMLGWQPKWNSKTAISKTINWYKNLDKMDAKNLVINDISVYLNE